MVDAASSAAPSAMRALKEGRFVGHGTHAELLANAGVYRDLFATQRTEEGNH